MGFTGCLLVFSNMDGLHIVALLCDYLTKIRDTYVKIFIIPFWLDPDNNDHCFPLSTLNSLEKVADFSAITNVTVAMIRKTFH